MNDNSSDESSIIMNQEVTQDVEHVTVMLEKAPNEQGFGIAISGGREGADQRGGDTSITISDVIRGSPADTLVNIGDVLIAINGTNVEDVEHGFAVDLLRSLKKCVYLLIKRRLFSYNNVKRESIPKLNMSVSSTPNFRINDRISCGRENLSRQKENEFIGFQQENIEKCKTGDRDDGICDNYQEISFSLDKGKSGFGLYLGNMIFVKDKVTGTSAQNSGIQVGDIVLTINGVPVECCRSTDEVLDLIKKSGKILNLGVLRPNTCWLPRPLALKTSYFTSTTPLNIKKKSHRRIASDLKIASVKPAVDAIKRSKRDKNSTKEKRLMDELTDNITSRSIETGEVGMPYQPSRSISPVTRIKKGQSLNRFDSQKIPLIKENPRFRERKSSRMTETYDTEQIIPIINEVHKKHFNRPRSSSTSSALKETRTVRIINSGEHLGVQLIGGNKSGIFISALMDNSPAALSGLRIGDQIVMVNDVDFRHVTREEAVIVLLSLKNGPVTINCVNKIATFEKVKHQQGDEFYIRVNFDYLKPNNPRELTLRKGELLIVRDTMFGGTIGSWSAAKVSINAEPGESGVIPNKARAEQSAVKSKLEERKNKEIKRRLRSGKNHAINLRGEYQSQDRLDAISFKDDSLEIPAYERVARRIADFKRPVIIIGISSDVFSDFLKMEHSHEFDYPNEKEMKNHDNTSSFKYNKNKKMVKLHDIRKIITNGKHCLLSVSVDGIEMLHHVNLSPIVILIKLSDKKLWREFRNAAVNMVYGQNEDKIDKKEIKHINRYGVRFERKYPMHIDAIIHVLDQPVDKIYMELMNIIKAKQNDEIFVSDDKIMDHNAIDSFILREPNYTSGCTSNSESCTEDDDMESNGEKKYDEDKVFKINRFDSNQHSQKNHKQQEEKNNNQGRLINIKYKDQSDEETDDKSEMSNYENLKSNLSSYTTTSNSRNFPSSFKSESNNIIKENNNNIELSLSAVLKIPSDNQGGLTESPSTKVSVYVPSGALNTSDRGKEIFLKVFLPKSTNQINNEETENPIILCGPEGVTFSRPIEIRIPFNQNKNEPIETKIRTSPDFYAEPNKWKKMPINFPGSYGNTFKLANNMIAILVDRF